MWKTAFKIFWRDKAYPLKFFKGCLPQILLDPLLNTLPQLLLLLAHSWRIFAFYNPENTKKLQISFQDKYDQLTLVVRKMRLTKTILFIIFLFLWFYWNDQFFTFKQKLLLFILLSCLSAKQEFGRQFHQEIFFEKLFTFNSNFFNRLIFNTTTQNCYSHH